MRTAHLLPLALLVMSSCKFDEPRLVSINPVHGYEDGCTFVEVRGSEIGTTAEISLGGIPMIDVAAAEYDDAFEDHAQDVGFEYTAFTPPNNAAAGTFVDVMLTLDGEEFVLDKAWYYLACPGEFNVEEATEEAPAGGAISFSGCGISSSNASISLYELGDTTTPVATASLVPLNDGCPNAGISGTIPDGTPEGTYQYLITTDDGTYGTLCDDTTGGSGGIDTSPDSGGDSGTDSGGDSGTDSGGDSGGDSGTDSGGDTGPSCVPTTITVTGGEE